MKASDLLKRYAGGERNFRGANLRGQSFKGKNLSDTDFSEADIRGANFTNATLKNVNFTGAKVGLQKRWLIGQLLTSILISVLLNFVSIVLNTFFVASFFDAAKVKEYTIFPGLLLLLIIGVTFFALACQGVTAKAATTIAVIIVIAIVAPGGGAAVAIGITIGIASAVAIAIAVVGAVIAAVASVAAIASVASIAASVTIAITFAGAIVMLNTYVAWRASKGDGKFALSRNASITFAAIGGTSFRGADLTDANFKNAILKSTNFNPAKQQKTILTQVCWQDAKNLDRARVNDSILKDPAVRGLLVTRDGHDKSYM
jgi:uncharacterized protein YjbI with pentapeptide repeats